MLSRLFAYFQFLALVELATPSCGPSVSVVRVHVRGFANGELTRPSSQSVAVLKRLFQELCYAVRRCANWRTISRMFWDYLKIDLWKNMICGSLRGIWTSIRHPRKTIVSAARTMRQFLAAIRRGDGDAILKLILTAASFAIGVHFGLGFPDIDLFGPVKIGGHRSILTHSAVPMILAEMIKLMLLRVGKTIFEHLPDNHHPAWDSIATGSATVLEGLTRGFQSGVAAHLLQDSFRDGSQNLRWVDGSSVVSKEQLITASQNAIYHREVTPSDLFMAINAGAGPLSGNDFYNAKKSNQ